MKNITIIIALSLILTSCGNTEKKESTWIPQLDGEWWQLTNTYPNISPYEWGPGDNKVCDFTIYQAIDKSWQCVACIRGNNYPGSSRFLYRWQANSLSETMWKEQGVFQSTGTDAKKEDGFGFVWDSTLYPHLGKLQAPHCIIDSNKYYLFYNNAGAMCKVSNNGLSWTNLKNDEGSYNFFNMGRDLMIFDDRDYSGNWIAYYTTGNDFPQYMGARTCKTLTGEWSDEKMIYDGWSNTRYPIYRNEMAESPFVVRFKDKYYLFAQMHVFVSDDPMDFTENKKIADLETGNYDERVWAPEIIINDGQYYLAAYRPTGLWMIKLKWIETTEIEKYN